MTGDEGTWELDNASATGVEDTWEVDNASTTEMMVPEP